MVDFQSRSGRRTDDGRQEETTETTDESDEDGAGVDAFAYAVVTVVPDRSIDDDEAGAAVVASIEATDATVQTRELIQPSYDGVQSTLRTLVNRKDIDAVVTLGGTGVAPTDVTVDALDPLLDKQLPGFGERFRALIDGETGAIADRSMAGIVDTVPVFAVPETTDGATTAVESLVLPVASELTDNTRID